MAMSSLVPRSAALFMLAGATTLTGCSDGDDAAAVAESTTTVQTTTADPVPSSSTATTQPEAPVDENKVSAAAQDYVDAVNAGDLDALVQSFAEDAEIVDVGRSIKGHDEIRTWADNEVIGGKLRVIEVSPMDGGQDLLVHWAPGGTGGFRAHYRFSVSGDDISHAELTYA